MNDGETLYTGEREVSEREVLADVTTMIADVLGEDVGTELQIGMDTQFAADLDLESIDLVTLSTRLREHYGEQVNFAQFVAGFELDELIELTVGQLVWNITRSVGDSEES